MFIRPAASSSIYDYEDQAEPDWSEAWEDHFEALRAANPPCQGPELPSEVPNWWALTAITDDEI